MSNMKSDDYRIKHTIIPIVPPQQDPLKTRAQNPSHHLKHFKEISEVSVDHSRTDPLKTSSDHSFPYDLASSSFQRTIPAWGALLDVMPTFAHKTRRNSQSGRMINNRPKGQLREIKKTGKKTLSISQIHKN